MNEVLLVATFVVAVVAGAATIVGALVQKHQSVSVTAHARHWLSQLVVVSCAVAVVAILSGLAIYAIQHRDGTRKVPSVPRDPTATRTNEPPVDTAPKQPFIVNAPRPANLEDLSAVEIPAGSCATGCSSTDTECHEDEFPRVDSSFARPFLMLIDEVTRKDYSACVAADVCSELPPNAGDWRSQPALPVTWVDADEANIFCNWKGGRLPTEAEWEYAARAGNDDAKFEWGDHIDEKNVVFGGNAVGPSAVGLRQPNGWGLRDMTGNVAEWCFPGSSTKASENVAVRGGAYDSEARELRLSARTTTHWQSRSPAIGFRCVGPKK